MDYPSSLKTEKNQPTTQAEPAASADDPRTVIRGESSQPHPEAAFTDWLNVSFPLPAERNPEEIVFKLLSEATDHAFGDMEDRQRGLHGYSRSFAFDRGTVLFAIGGQRETGFISVPGDGCALVSAWPRLSELFQHRLGGRITRWDGAVDDFAGAHSVDLAVELWKLGGFSTGGTVLQSISEAIGSNRTARVERSTSGGGERQAPPHLRERQAAWFALASLGSMGSRTS